MWVDDSGSVTRHHSISSPVRRVEASPLPCLASEGGSSGFSVAVKGMADTRRYFADFPGKLCRREAEFPHPLSTQHLNRTTLVEWENRVIRPNRIVCLIQASQGTPFSNKFFKISFHRIDSCLILRGLTFNWIDVGNIVFKVFCKSGLRSDESR